MRWVTRLENILINPITVKKIELATGHRIEEILEDISLLRDADLPQNVKWMTQVTEAESRLALASYLKWAKKDMKNDNYVRTEHLPYIESLTPHAARVEQWHVNGYFPLVEKCSVNSLKEYLSVISKGAELFVSVPYRIVAEKAEIAPDGKSLMIICKCGGVKPYALMKVEVLDEFFVHSYRMFFGYDGAEKYYELSLGRKWTGGMVFDDYC